MFLKERASHVYCRLGHTKIVRTHSHDTCTKVTSHCRSFSGNFLCLRTITLTQCALFGHLFLVFCLDTFPHNINIFYLCDSRQHIRAKVWDRRTTSVLFQIPQYSADLETLFRKMWEKHEKGEEMTHLTEMSLHVGKAPVGRIGEETH